MSSIKRLTAALQRQKMIKTTCKPIPSLVFAPLINSLNFFCSQKAEEEDVVDSDFSSTEEEDEPVSDHEDEDDGRRRKRKVVTRAYKEPPAKKKAIPAKTSKSLKAKPEKKKTPKKVSPLSPRLVRKFTVLDSRKSLRESTTLKAQETQIRLKARLEAEKSKVKVAKVEEYIPTQEELIEEAKETEKENLKSLEKFRRMELEKKKVRPTKVSFLGPVIRYHSTTMPLVEEVVERNPKNEELRRSERKAQEKKILVTNKCERTFVTFIDDIDDKVFSSIFKPKGVRRRFKPQFCPITHLPARYFDPITQLPYRNLQAFKIIREAYYQQLEERGNSDNPQVVRWLEWRKKVKDYRAKFSKSTALASL